MIDHHGAWLPSVKFGLAVLIVLGVACLAITVLAVMASVVKYPRSGSRAGFGSVSSDYTRDHDHWIWAWLPALTLLILVICVPLTYYPYSGDYHRLQPATGTVTAIDTRFLQLSQYVVITYETGLVVRCDDSRCATVRAGDQLRLLCTKEHQLGSPLAADGWGCRWGEGNR